MTLRRNSSMDSSIASDDLSNPMSKLICMVKQSKKVFVGTYTERRYVQSVPTYRDIVTVDKEETEVIQCLIEIQKVVREEFGREKFLGITCNMQDNIVVNYNLWVELDQVPLGKHWFQIRSLKMNQNTIHLQLKHLRPFKDKEPASIFNQSTNSVALNIGEIFTYRTLCDVTKFCAVLVMSIITVIGHILWYMCEYALRLSRELSHLITALTPIVFGFYEVLTKCFGGLLWLFYMIFSGNSGPRNPPPMAIMSKSPPPIEYQRRYSNRSFR